MARYLVTGAAGFIGSNVASRLLATGNEVFGLDSLNSAYDPRLKRYRLEGLCRQAGFRFAELDITDGDVTSNPGRVARAFGEESLGEVQAAFNLAARAGIRRSLEIPGEYLATNVQGTLHLLELCRKAAIPSFVLASSSSLYGATEAVPFRENADTSHPLSPYAASKKAAEVLGHSYHHLYGTNVVALRYFTVYGPCGRPDMSPFRFVRWIEEQEAVIVTGDGSQSRDFTYVDDIVEGTIAAAALTGFEIVNLGSDRPYSVLELVGEIEKATEKRARVFFVAKHDADMACTWADCAKARAVLGWRPRVALTEGVQRLVDWYRAEHGLASSIDLGC